MDLIVSSAIRPANAGARCGSVNLSLSNSQAKEKSRAMMADASPLLSIPSANGAVS